MLALSPVRNGLAVPQFSAGSYSRENRNVSRTKTFARLLTLLFIANSSFGFTHLTPETSAAFDRYVQNAEARMNRDLQPDRFLHMNASPDLKAKLRGGEVRIESGAALNGGKEAKVPDGMIQDWMGMMFIPNATLHNVKAVLQDYENYKNYYQPDVIESKQLAHQGDEYDAFLRLYKKQILTVVLNTTYHVRYSMLDPQRMSVVSRSTRIAEVKDHKRSYAEEEPIGNDTGFLWRLNSYWRFEEADGGVYAQCQAISLSRDVPMGLGWMIKGFVSKFPRESMQNTLRGTKAAVQQTATSPQSPATSH
jgi:hypothetical protein